MLSDDVYRARLQATIASLRYWTPEVKDVAQVEESDGLEFWKLAITPRVAGACPVELMLRTDQKHDLIIAGEVFEDRESTSLEMFVPFVDAVADGRVTQRLHRSAATGAPLKLETIVAMDGGATWRAERRLDAAAPVARDAESVVEERHYLPYRR